jgi:putative ABC transport system substrate-binding protein
MSPRRLKRIRPNHFPRVKILRGENPGEIPIYQADKFVLAINLKTAKALGLVLPASMVARADLVIE